MKFNLEDLNPGVFFSFKDDEEGGGVTLRLSTAAVIEEITKKCSKKRVEFKRGQRFEVIDEDIDKKDSMLWDYVIMDWKGICDEKGDPIPCNSDNKKLLMRNSVQFSSFVGACLDILNDDAEKYKETLEKN
jgi:hypothetical protein